MNFLLEKFEQMQKIEKIRAEDPEHFPKAPEFVELCEIDEDFNRYLFYYLKKDYEKTSQEFKDACSDYNKIAWNFDLTPYNVSGGKSGDSFVGMIGAFPLRIGSISTGGIGGSGAELRKLIKAEKKLLKFEEKEGIKRISGLEKDEIMARYNHKVDKFVKEYEANKTAKHHTEELVK